MQREGIMDGLPGMLPGVKKEGESNGDEWWACGMEKVDDGETQLRLSRRRGMMKSGSRGCYSTEVEEEESQGDG